MAHPCGVLSWSDSSAYSYQTASMTFASALYNNYQLQDSHCIISLHILIQETQSYVSVQKVQKVAPVMIMYVVCGSYF